MDKFQQIKNLKVGQEFIVAGFVECDASYRRKLLAMGLIKGVKAKLKRVAPAGDPIEIEVKGQSVSLRKVEANAIKITAL